MANKLIVDQLGDYTHEPHDMWCGITSLF